jgi:hypothetical protein
MIFDSIAKLQTARCCNQAVKTLTTGCRQPVDTDKQTKCGTKEIGANHRAYDCCKK